MLWKSGEIKKKDNFTWMIKQIQHVPNYTLIFLFSHAFIHRFLKINYKVLNT